MTAAIYARQSTEQPGVIDDANSVTRHTEAVRPGHPRAKHGGAILLLLCVGWHSACADPVNKEKVSRAGHALKQHVTDTGCGGGTGTCEELSKAFRLEADVLASQARNPSEERAAAAYKEAAEAYAFFARLRYLEADAVTAGGGGAKILLIGTNEASAKKFGIPLDNRGWADTSEALRRTLSHGEQRFAEAERVVAEQ